MSDPALLAALQLLATSIADLPANIILANQQGSEQEKQDGRVPAFDRPQPVVVMGPNPLPVTGVGAGAAEKKGPAEREERDEPGSAGRAFGAVLARFAAVVAPLAVLGQVIGATTSGFGVLQKSVSLFATAVAPVLLPVTMLLATAFTAAADVISGMLPGLEGFLGLILGFGIPVLVTFIGAIEVIAKKLAEWAKGLNAKAEDGKEAAAVVFGPGEAGERYQRYMAEEEAKLKAEGWKDPDSAWYVPASVDRTGEARRRADARMAEEDAGGKPVSTAEATVMRALRDVATSFSMSIGPKAQISGLEGVGKSAQLAALNQDPIEARALRIQTQIRDMLMTAIAGMGGTSGVYFPGPDEGGWLERRGGGYRGTGGDAGGSF